LHSRAAHPLTFVLFGPVVLAGLFGVWITLQGAGLAVVALSVLGLALGILVLSPRQAFLLLVATRFCFEMFWDQRVLGFSVLDFLGAGVPLAVLVVIALSRARVTAVPLAKPLIAWAFVLAGSAAVFTVVHGKSLVVLENTLRMTCGIPIFLLTVMVVRDFDDAWKVLRLWLFGAVPVALIFYVYGDHMAMEYHGVIRQKAFYHDVVTPAVVACMAMLISVYLIGMGSRRGWRPGWLVALVCLAAIFGRMLFLTFHNALAGVAVLSLVTFYFLRRRVGVILCVLITLVLLSQDSRVQQRWWREVAILKGEKDAIAFASGRPNQWRYYLAQYEDLNTVDQMVGVHGTWGDPENQFLQLLGDVGPVLGLLTVGLLIWILWMVHRWGAEETHRERRQFFHFIEAVLFGTSAAWITATPLTYSNFQWFLFCLLGLAAAVRRQSLQEGSAATPV